MSEIRKHVEEPMQFSRNPAPKAPKLEASNDTADVDTSLQRAVEDDLKASLSRSRPRLVPPTDHIRPSNASTEAPGQTQCTEATPVEAAAEARVGLPPGSSGTTNRPAESRVADGMKVIDADYGPVRMDEPAGNRQETGKGGGKGAAQVRRGPSVTITRGQKVQRVPLGASGRIAASVADGADDVANTVPSALSTLR